MQVQQNNVWLSCVLFFVTSFLFCYFTILNDYVVLILCLYDSFGCFSIFLSLFVCYHSFHCAPRNTSWLAVRMPFRFLVLEDVLLWQSFLLFFFFLNKRDTVYYSCLLHLDPALAFLRLFFWWKHFFSDGQWKLNQSQTSDSEGFFLFICFWVLLLLLSLTWCRSHINDRKLQKVNWTLTVHSFFFCLFILVEAFFFFYYSQCFKGEAET